MFCSPWACRWKVQDRPFVSRLADEQHQKKLPGAPTHWSESRSAPKTRTNMRSLRQLEFSFEQLAIAVVGGRNPILGEGRSLPYRQQKTEAHAVQLRRRDTALEADACELLSSLGAK